jgi:hypothetical protein
LFELSRRELLKAGIGTSASVAGRLGSSTAASSDPAQPVPSPDASTRQTLDLSGTWRFRRADASRQGVSGRWFDNPLFPIGRSTISLPGTTDQAGAGVPNPYAPSLSGLYRPNVYFGPAWYQRDVVIPPEWKGRHLTSSLERVHWFTHTWLDGKDMGERESLISRHIYVARSSV